MPTKTETPKSVIDKWINFDSGVDKSTAMRVLDIPDRKYRHFMEKPWKHFTIEHMKKASILANRSLIEVFWACYKKPYSEIADDDDQIRLNQALERAGIL